MAFIQPTAVVVVVEPRAITAGAVAHDAGRDPNTAAPITITVTATIITVTVTVTDDDGDSGAGTWTVTVLNVAPVAFDDAHVMNEDDVLAVAAPSRAATTTARSCSASRVSPTRARTARRCSRWRSR